MNQRDVLASAQIIAFNPVLQKSKQIRVHYFLYLKKLLKLVKWDKRKYSRAQLSFYKNKLCVDQGNERLHTGVPFSPQISLLIPFDFVAMTGYHPKIMQKSRAEEIARLITLNFRLKETDTALLLQEFRAMQGGQDEWDMLFKQKELQEYLPYLMKVRENISFIRERPYNIFITATMSAGKSTLINAIVGKNISLAQNMACTSKIHIIVSKPFEDGASSEYDHELLMDATTEDLLSDNEANKSTRITVGTYFNGLLQGQRIVFFDSPGVNSSQNADHAAVTYKMIRSKKYRLIVYVLNATQLQTTDEEQHLEEVRKRLGRTKIIFVMNRIDHLISEDDDITASIEKQRKFLIERGFQDPIICPVSARAAFLAKKSRQEEMSRIERRELENYMDKFEVQSLAAYYEQTMKSQAIPDSHDGAQQLLKNCGFSYLEMMIHYLKNGGRVNGTGVC